MAIEEFGFSLLERADKQRRQQRREQKKADKYALIGSLAQLGIGFANKQLEKKANNWLNDERILAEKLAYKRSYDDASTTISDWDKASKHSGGVYGWLEEKVRPQVKNQFDLEVDEAMLADPDAYNKEINRRVKDIIGDADGDGLYGKFSAARNAAIKLGPDADYDTFIKNKNPAYRNVKDVIFGHFQKDKPSKEGYINSVLESKFSDSREAYDAASIAYSKGLSAVGSLKLGESIKDQFKLKDNEYETSEQVVQEGPNGEKILLDKITVYDTRSGKSKRSYFQAKKDDKVGQAFVANNLAKIEEVEVLDEAFGIVRKTKVGLNGQAIIESKTVGFDSSVWPSNLGAVSDDAGKRLQSNIRQALLDKDTLDDFNSYMSLGGKEFNEDHFLSFSKATHLLALSLRDKVFGSEDVQSSPDSFTLGKENQRIANDLAAEIMTMQVEYAKEKDTKGLGLGQNLMSEVVGKKGNIRGPLVLLGLDRLNRRANGTYDMSSFSQKDFESLVKSTVSDPEMRRFEDGLTKQGREYIQDIIKQSLKDGVYTDQNGELKNSSVFAIPYRDGGRPISVLFGVELEQEKESPYIGSIKIPDAREVVPEKEEVKEEKQPEPKLQSVDELLKRKGYLESRLTGVAERKSRPAEKEELDNINMQLASMGEETTPVYVSRRKRKEINSNIMGLFDATQQLKRQPAGAKETQRVKNLEEDIDEFSSALEAARQNTRPSFIADQIKNIKNIKSLNKNQVEEILSKAYKDEDFVNQVIVSLYL